MGPPKFAIIYFYIIATSVLVYFSTDFMRPYLVDFGVGFLYYVVLPFIPIFNYFYFKTCFTDPGALLRNQNYDHMVLTKEMRKIGKDYSTDGTKKR